MNRKFKGLLTVCCSAVVAFLAFSQAYVVNSDEFCSNVISAKFNAQLPVSHPANRCAVDRHNDVSWSAWFSGKSKSYQFHYLDLLELISRSSERNAHQHHQN